MHSLFQDNLKVKGCSESSRWILTKCCCVRSRRKEGCSGKTRSTNSLFASSRLGNAFQSLAFCLSGWCKNLGFLRILFRIENTKQNAKPFYDLLDETDLVDHSTWPVYRLSPGRWLGWRPSSSFRWQSPKRFYLLLVFSWLIHLFLFFFLVIVYSVNLFSI